MSRKANIFHAKTGSLTGLKLRTPVFFIYILKRYTARVCSYASTSSFRASLCSIANNF